MDIPKATAIPLLNTISAESGGSYDYSKLKTPLIYGTFIIVMLILISVVIGLIYSNSINLPNGKMLSQRENDTAMMIVAFTIAILLIVFMTIPNYKEFLNFISRIKFVLLLAAYIVGLIILYRNVPRGIVDAYSFLFFPVTMLIGIYLFYLAMEKGQLYGFDLNYERVKYALIYFCLIVFMLLFYTVDPGGYLKTYFGPSLIITILLAIFGFLYLVTLMTLPTIQGSRSTGLPGADASAGGLFKGLSRIALFSGIGFLIFLIITVAGILGYPGGFTSGTGMAGSEKTTAVSGIVILLIIIFILWILFFGVLSFSDVKLRDSGGNLDTSMSNITKIARQVFMLLFGLIFSGILIGWLVTGVESLSSKSGIMSFILNLVIVLAVLALVFKLVTGGNYYKKSPFFRLIVNTLLYIPCILVGILDPIFTFLGFGAGVVGKAGLNAGKTGLSGLWHGLTTTIEATRNTPTAYYVLLIVIILLYVVYFFLGKVVQTNVSKQGGSLLVNSPISTNSENSIGLYDNLNGTSDDNPYNYKYAISFWVFIDAMSPNISSSLNRYTSLLNYGNKPNVLYNASENTIMITLENDGEPAIGSDSRLRNPQELDASGNIIVYKLSNVLLQKWNNIVINYSNGTLDIFYNGQLMKSVNEAVPQMSKDTLTIGSPSGINGAICNVTYFNTSVTMPQIYYLYNLVKNKNPPVVNSDKESIIKNVLNGANINANPPVITIPIKIDVKTAVPDSESYPDKPAKPDENDTKTDYLSFKWFATANNDNFNGV
jgi:hypothetical protein